MAIERRPLTRRQEDVLAVIQRYYEHVHEPCSVRYIARRLKIHPSTAQAHVDALFRKGHLTSPSAPIRRAS